LFEKNKNHGGRQNVKVWKSGRREVDLKGLGESYNSFIGGNYHLRLRNAIEKSKLGNTVIMIIPGDFCYISRRF